MDYKKIYAIKMQNEKRIKQLCADATHKSGIYCFHREDENGFKYAYVGLATKSVLSRCAEHLSGYTQHIDRSLKAHKLYDKENPYGWKLDILCFCSAEECNEKEQFYIKKVHQSGRQLLNVTGGSQGKGKFNIGQSKPPKTYTEGVVQGEKNMAKRIKHLFDLHLDYVPKKNPPTKLQEKAMQKFKDIMEANNDAD
jgi:hypothetical protein